MFLLTFPYWRASAPERFKTRSHFGDPVFFFFFYFFKTFFYFSLPNGGNLNNGHIFLLTSILSYSQMCSKKHFVKNITMKLWPDSHKNSTKFFYFLWLSTNFWPKQATFLSFLFTIKNNFSNNFFFLNFGWIFFP